MSSRFDVYNSSWVHPKITVLYLLEITHGFHHTLVAGVQTRPQLLRLFDVFMKKNERVFLHVSGHTTDSTQLAAACSDGTSFSQYVMPSKEINLKASEVTGREWAPHL